VVLKTSAVDPEPVESALFYWIRISIQDLPIRIQIRTHFNQITAKLKCIFFPENFNVLCKKIVNHDTYDNDEKDKTM
jgi:hypothetical protein